MAVIYGHVAPQFERARVPLVFHHRSYDELHERAMFWRIAIPGTFLFWVCVAYGIYSLG